MKGSQKITLISLLILAAAGVAGLILTSGSRSVSRLDGKQQVASGAELINQQFLNTARRLSALATSPDELTLARDALRLTDRDLEMQFAAALQLTAHQPPVQTTAVRAIQERIRKIETGIEAKQDEVQGLTEAVKTAKKRQQDSLQEQLDVAQAELNLYKEALGDAQEDLIRAGGDPHAKVQRLIEEHQATAHEVDAMKPAPSSQPSAPSSDSLIAKWSYWKALRQKQEQILQGRQEAYAAAAAIVKNHDVMEQQVQNEQARRSGTAVQNPGPATSQSAGTTGNDETASQGTAAAAVSALKRLAEDRKTLAILGRRIQYLQDLGSVYDKWDGLVIADKQQALHGLIASTFWIVLMLLFMFVLNRVTESLLSRLKLENKERATLQAMVRISIQVVTAGVVLIVIFGPPNQLSTVLGLAGAGLTVVLKDFIVSFLGWFVLMGRQGIRVGDWVEINGVRGEVIEITLLRTILLETGNWTDSGQPTGRQVAFLNQYAIDGYYFNFTTAGQWLWDELQILIPRGEDPYPLIEKIQAIVAQETQANTRLAESEWQRVSRRYGVRSFSAQPTVNVRPSDAGVSVIVRYIAPAHERTEVRHRLNHAIVKLRNQEGKVALPVEAPPAPVGAKQS